MSTGAIAVPNVSSNPVSRNLGIFASETRYEFVRLMRTRTFSLSVIGFPVMFYCLFGLLMNRGQSYGGMAVAKYLLAGYAVFGVVGTALFGIGVGLAAELSAGWLELKRASPMPAVAYLLAKCCTAMAFGVLIVSVLCGLGIAFGGMHLTLMEYVRMIGLAVAGAVPFACMGLVLALVVPVNSAPGIANMIYLPMSFCSGLWIPLKQLPHALQLFAPVLPTYHLVQLMLGVFGYASAGRTSTHWLALGAFAGLMMGIAWFAFRRREQNA